MESQTARRRIVAVIAPIAVLIIVAVAITPLAPHFERAVRRASPHAPNWALWDRLDVPVQIHAVSAVTALFVGLTILALPKGRGLHKPLGWVWVLAMGSTAISSLFVTGLNGGFYSPVHLLTGWTLVALPLGVMAIRKRNVIAHKRAMIGLFLGGLVLAGALTFLPGRFMFQLFFG
jgi:uncharacterized membrane protein